MSTELLSFRGCDSSRQKADIVLLGAPLDASGKTAAGPDAIRRGSRGLESFSLCQGRDLSGCPVWDAGDLAPGEQDAALDRLEKAVADLSGRGKLPFLLGGPGPVTLGAVRGLAGKYPRLHLIQFAAHAGLRPTDGGNDRACVMRRCYELLGEGKIHQFCIRSGVREEFAFALKHTDMHPFNFGWLEPTVHGLIREQVPVYLSIALDCLDPSELPGTEFPEAGGLRFSEVLEAALAVCRTHVVGVDVTELAPDPGGISAAAAAKLVREILIALSAGKNL